MEVKLVITPSEEMVQLVDKVINAFARGHQLAPHKDSPSLGKPLSETPVEEVAETVLEKKEGEATPNRRRRTKTEIEAEKQAEVIQEEAAEQVEEAPAEEAAEQVEGAPTEETVTEAPMTTFVADVVRLRKMTVRRSELIGDVPAKLLEFGYNSVTSLAKDAVAAEKYFNYLVSVSPISVEDNA